MFQKLVSRNDDLRRLVEKGFAVGFDSNYLIVRDIPYLDDKGVLQWGAFVTKLVFTDPEHVAQEDHQVFFAGSHPHNLDGTPITNLGGGTTSLALSPAADDVIVQRQFSNKPRVSGHLVGFPDFFAKIESYTSIIAGPAMSKNSANPYTFRSIEDVADNATFKIQDTMTSRAEITDLSDKLKNEIVAIIGLGGTGAHLLDFLVKSWVKEIRGFDRDVFHVHNAFRSPGKLDEAEFKKPKADVYQARYENIRNGLSLQAKYIDASCLEELEGVTFAFVCVDKGSSRSGIFDLLITKKIPFIDTGMGLNRKNDALNGQLRVTYYSVENAQAQRDLGRAEMSDRPDEEYRTNIQISELNAMNAALAITKFKQLKGFYFDEDPSSHMLFEIADHKIVSNPDVEET
ncbi:MAG: ThiF family adenylyltransferase [Mesorhizobium sp.]|nr:ThiF family adenylyltransferase [Mesorhizobium sp. M8A.F.Ca.ET.023.02.2.1]RWC74986.1 MAG: ThiF family adenylyltransferase [Mesorhizobium sp.]